MPPPAPSRPQTVQRPGALGPARPGVRVPGRSTGQLLHDFFFGRVGAGHQNVAPDRLSRGGLAGVYSPREPGTMSLLPTRITSYVRQAFWNPAYRYQRREFVAEPPMLPGTAIPFTLFHPNYVGGGGAGPSGNGLQGYKWTLPWNFAWAWHRASNFANFGTYEMARDGTRKPTTYQSTGTRAATIREPNAMRQPIGIGQGLAWFQPAPYYTPNIINPPKGMGGGNRGHLRWRRADA